MVLFAALALAAESPEPASPPVQRVVAERQAMAVVRILPGAQLKFSELEKSAPERFRDTQIRNADGSSEPARVVEFQ